MSACRERKNSMLVLKKTKELLQNVLPSSSKTLHRKTEVLEKKIDEANTQLNVFDTRFSSMGSQIDAICANQTKLNEKMTTILSDICVTKDSILNCANTISLLGNRISEHSKNINSNYRSIDSTICEMVENVHDIRSDCKIYYWNNAYEKEAISNNYGNLIDEEGFKDKYFSLIRGLDQESILTINRIIWNQSQYLRSDKEKMDLFTLDEQDVLRRVDDIFSKNVVKISENIYAYGKYLLPVNHFEPVVFHYKYCLNEVNELDRVKGKTIIDAGAFIGDTALLFSELEPSRIVSFEPIPENADLCEQTIALNNLNNVVLERMALGLETTTMCIFNGGEGSTIYPRKEDEVFYKEKIDVPVVTLDQYANENALEIGLIKMDIEGAGSDCLKGAKQIIEKQRPIMLICIYHNKHDFFDIKTMLEEWGLDYHYKIRKPIAPNATYETLLIAEPMHREK